MQKSHCKQLLHDRGICVIIPTYNNAGTIADVVERTLLQCDCVIVVNDGSTDGTSEILAKIPGITLVQYEKNAGKGTALKRGFRKAKELGYAYAITLDADGQHYPEDIPILAQANVENPGAIIVGQRNMEGVVRSKGSEFANAFSNFWFCVQTCKYIPDTQTGFRLYPLKKLHGLRFLTSRYEAELELLVFSAWHGVKIVPVEVNVFYPPREERVSHFRPAYDFTRISILNTLLCVIAVVYAFPKAILRDIYTLVYSIFGISVYLTGALGVITPIALFYLPIAKMRGGGTLALHTVLNWFGKLVRWLLGLFGSKVTVENPEKEDFSRPAVIICNHQSYLDLIIQISLTKKLVFLTNDWVWNSPVLRFIVRNAEYYPVSMGVETLMPKLQDLVKRGYSISVFPEGTRSQDGRIGRFHKGAFLLAKELDVDLLPLEIYGAGRVWPKHIRYMRRWPIILKVMKRFSPRQLAEIGETDRDRAKWFRKLYIEKLAKISNRVEQDV